MKEKFMLAALKEANKARLKDEVPVGCVIVKDDKIIARGHNKKEKNKNQKQNKYIYYNFNNCKNRHHYGVN